MKFRILFLALASIGLASATTIIQTKSFSFTPTASSSLTFDMFNNGLGTLTAITVTTNVTKSGGSLYVDNDSVTGGSGIITQSVTITLSGPPLITNSFGDIASKSVTATSSYSATVGPDDGDGAGFQIGGVDYAGTTFGDTSASKSADVGSVVWGDYRTTGAGTYIITASGTQAVDYNSISGVAFSGSPAAASGDVTVTYTYTAAVPETSSALLGGLGVLALMRRRRL
ncbi:MAG: choice-of-anchor E domain-containing protein [Verrucomicrobiota bacterium]